MPARIHEIQTHIIFSIHNQTYHPIQPPSKIGLSRICRKERERHEIYGDALLGERLTSFLFHEFPSQSAGFISCIKAAMLSNHTFTNILLKARGHSDMNGFPVDKSVADAFETMAAISYLECGRKKFEVWFRDTFAPLVTEAAAFWNRADTFYRGFSDTDAPESATTTENILPLLVPKKSWVESCILAAASTPDPPATSRFTQVVPMRPSMRRRRLEEVTDGQPPPKRRWTEAMEMAGNQDGLTKSNWVEAMATNNSEPSLLISKKMKQCAKENHRPLPKAEPRRRRTRWDIQPSRTRPQCSNLPHSHSPHDVVSLSAHDAYETTEVPASIVPSLPILHRSTEPPATQIKLFPSAAPTPSSPTQPLETSLERELLEPLWMEPPNPALDGANFTPGYDDEPRSRGGTCSPMEVSPNCSPTRFILPPLEFAGLQHTAVDLAIGSPVTEKQPNVSLMHCNPRRRSDSLLSTALSMDASPCSFPAKLMFSPSVWTNDPDAGAGLAPTNQARDSLCWHTRYGHIGASQQAGPLPAVSVSTQHVAESVVALGSTFWPGKKVVFTYKQQQRPPLQPILKLD